MDDTSVEELIQKRNQLNKELASWQNKAAVAKADEERIRKEISSYLEILKNEYGCTSFEDAKEKLEKLKRLALTQIEGLEAQLNDLRNP